MHAREIHTTSLQKKSIWGIRGNNGWKERMAFYLPLAKHSIGLEHITSDVPNQEDTSSSAT